jgi:hypothetical protein
VRTHTATVNRHTDAPVDQVWDLLARTEAWPAWAPIREAELEHPSSTTDREGVGAIRSLRTPLGTTREQVVTFAAPHHLGYVMLSGLPVEDYHADVILEPDGDGTRITWTSTFRAGAFWAVVVGLILRRFSRHLAVAAQELAVRES